MQALIAKLAGMKTPEPVKVHPNEALTHDKREVTSRAGGKPLRSNEAIQAEITSLRASEIQDESHRARQREALEALREQGK
jgi:hypothetical protein